MTMKYTPGPNQERTVTGNTAALTTSDFYQMHQQGNLMMSAASSAIFFARASERSGGTVVLNPQYGCLPMIMGRDEKPVLMYKFVEVLHELISLSEVQQELPSLSYKQIEGGITFLRVLAQFNTRDLDIDLEEERHLEADEDFQREIKAALKLEPTRVFTFKQQIVR
jgi:hypothetical protein